jgi:hypothetical protein
MSSNTSADEWPEKSPILDRGPACLTIHLPSSTFSYRRKRAFIFPILNEHLRAIGPEMARRDIAECQSLAEAAGSSPNQSKGGEVARNTIGGGALGAATGAVGGAVVGSAGSGSAIGAASGAAAGLLRGLFSRSESNQVYVAFVNQCLQERGYEVVGWE